MEAVVSHYFTDPDGHSAPVTISVKLGGRSVELLTDNGVFSRSGLDAGTAVLLGATPPPPAEGHLVDLGCGYGPIAIALAMASPRATVWAVDVNRRARELCELNCRALGLTNVTVRAPDQIPDDLVSSGIWSNPPIRIGKAALHALLGGWLDRLESTAKAYLVVQKNLGSDSLQAWLNAAGWPTDRMTSRKAYRVLRVTSRRTVQR